MVNEKQIFSRIGEPIPTKKGLPTVIARETSEEHGTNQQAGADWSMLYSSEGLISACGLVPSVFGRQGLY